QMSATGPFPFPLSLLKELHRRAPGQGIAVVGQDFNRNIEAPQQPQQGQRLELECWRNKTSWRVSWIRLDRDGNLHYILSSYITNTTIFQGGERTSPRFEASWSENTCRLVVKSFSTEDEGFYFCVTNVNQVLQFSSGQPAFFPGQQQLHPPRLHPAPLPVPSQHGPSPTLPMALLLCPRTCNENNPNSSCEVFFWVRVAGTCLLLLIRWHVR
uniref:Ig-like domain-containing protein n=1 Tax=Coturnix japonica TaxID=93934 RepID=A0A8C2T2Z1_COTJA